MIANDDKDFIKTGRAVKQTEIPPSAGHASDPNNQIITKIYRERNLRGVLLRLYSKVFRGI
jgi:hypothetical protein